MDDLPDELPEQELQRARKLTAALDEGARQFGLVPLQARIGLTEAGATAVEIDFRLLVEPA